MDDRYQYLLLMAGCILLTLPLEWAFGARVYRRPRRLLVALLPMLAVFLAWDVLGILRGHWDYSDRYTTGVVLPFGVPVEEVVFFVVVPVCGLLTYESVGTVLRRRRERTPGRGGGHEEPVGERRA
ncbi:lycopene cyclase domain-containing protein [Phycicoccus endophyticus]|uniref:Lycopene cyclase domain-containing protein n=1 Tax=Phycicoccus endophyticus TaxID=1690220 RepID=A0A7G9R0J3_9MICO|nr:lycopene cyclase domain-containing protein [Phycicoccus endophyticus]NHI19395.1 lycopene cyclase domain-containing protein [Phycicoccus endophyticus]QNN49118.1 lycopene cyclase domain-containing protein [Phycicoccus endophyticus]GGL38751.1 lycopene cyclase [Phycicoccus endophyticus]